MKSRKQRTVKTGSSKRKAAPSDVSPSTSLPPLVEGQLRCFLRVTVSRVLWTVHKPPSATFVRLRWWGESSNGTHFFPRDGSQTSQKTIKTTARFPIRCGPKQFTSYLTDMGSLVLEILTKPDHLPIARAQVAGIPRLSLSHPISGFYTLVSPTSEKLGELQVSLYLEPLAEAYDSSSSGPTTDLRVEGQLASLTVPSQPKSVSAGSGRESAGSSGGNTPRGKDHLYFQNKDNEEFLENQMPGTNRSQNGQTAVNLLNEEPGHGQATNDLISVILERGNKLRNAMVKSAVKCDMNSGPTLKDTPLPLPKDNVLPPTKPLSSHSGRFLENILHADSSRKPSDDVAVVSDCGFDSSVDMDNRAVDLLLGSINSSPLPAWDGEVLFPEPLSGHSSVCGDSELNDPQYDQSLLENLFYKTPMSDTRTDDTELKVQETEPSRKSHQKKQILGAGKPLTQPGPKISEDLVLDGVFPPGLTANQLNMLGLIQLARVSIDSLTLPSGSRSTTPRKASDKGKPPQPLTSKKCTYFIEYVFPRASMSHQRDRSKAAGEEVTRAVSSKTTVDSVKFQQHSEFPVHLSKKTVKQWWESELIFKIYSRKNDQKKPVFIGKAVHPLRCLLQSKQLTQSVVLPVNVEGSSETKEIGPLKVTLELVATNKTSEKSKSRLSLVDASPSHTQKQPSSSIDVTVAELPVTSPEGPRLNVWSPLKVSEELSSQPSLHTFPHKSWQQVEEDPEVLLHALLMVPDGRNFQGGPMQAPNVYLNCKLFWCDETARSAVSWGQANPSFNFVQVTPVALTTKLLQRLKNNVMVIEVWQKMGTLGEDQLIGLVKLPLHQFYMSFRDQKIAHLLLQAQYPVLGVDCYMPVIDVFSGSCNGNLRVILAMGHSEQIVALQRARDEESDSLPHPVRPFHLLDHQPHSQTKVSTAQQERMREHLFVIRVEKVSGLTPLQSTVWGEADCYIQYSFPYQEGDLTAKMEQDLIESTVDLKPFRTITTLCVPDPVFGHTETHVLLAPEGVPVQRLLLSSFSSQRLSGGGSVQFEVWCRYYYPNVRDQLVAKGVLPLSKLCAMVTMQRQHPNEAQTFSLPLVPRTDSPTGHQPQPSGLLDVSICYKHRPVRSDGQMGRGAASRVVTLVIKIHRASGLQAAARVLSEQNQKFAYYAEVGVNSFVTIQLSFLPENEKRCTRVAARTFSPEFDHHTELCCDLLVQRSTGETSSLAEQLEQASAIFTVWNKESRKAMDTSRPKDVPLGTAKIPLTDLIHKSTGIAGWFGVYSPQQASSSQDHQILVGGLEISVNFAHHSDRERVIKAAQGLGWERQENEDTWDESVREMSLTISMPRVWLPLHCLLLAGQSELQRSTYCYFRYRFYDQEAFCSQMKHPSVEEGQDNGPATVSFEGSRTVELRSTQPLLWYLREERLEVQVWVTFKKEKTQRPSDTDRLVGSAFLDLSSLGKISKKKLTLSGVYPLFRRSAADLQGAALRVHITLSVGSVIREASAVADVQVDSDSQGALLSEEVETDDRASLPTSPKRSWTQRKHQKKSSRTTIDFTSSPHIDFSMDESFPVTVIVDSAMHLNLKGCPLTDRSEGAPCCCVSYVTVDSAEPVSTDVIANCDCPVWDHQHECRLSKELLTDPQQSLVFKVWHKGEIERVIGFAAVDLSPLLCGFQSVCGWYNITDFSGQCHGQLKVSVTPLKGIHDLRGQRKSVCEESAKTSSASFQAFPLSYQTTATYSSFPSHISRYPEQKISSPNHTDELFSERSCESDRHFEHMDKVRRYHQTLQEQTAVGEITPSSSILMSTLRKKLSELDNIQRYFNRKLSTPTFPSVSDEDFHAKQEEQRNIETDTSQLLLKSKQLVGEVNTIISGLQEKCLETIPSNPQSILTSVDDDSPHTVLERIPTPHRTPHSPQHVLSPPLSPQPNIFEDRVNSEADKEKDGPNFTTALSEDENEGGADGEDGSVYRGNEEPAPDDEEEEENEDYEEVVVKPRHLNELTSLTDRTSPWTSILSDPDLVSLENLDEPEEPDLNQGEEDKHQQTVNLDIQGSSGKCTCREHSEEEGGRHQTVSGSDASDTESDETEEETELSSATKGLGDTCLSPTQEPPSESHDVSSSLHSEDSQLQLSVLGEVPNFFLPSHQLEASMRAIRLAPSFSQSSSDLGQSHPGQSILTTRGPRQRPNMSPSSMKKETERIAKIFSAHCNEGP
ncbi:C2 domain-containing protein 3 isoform X2 [Sphaeramia orbicularis]|uniref:C2 domain-containing protein 3 isoform X2 n=1 Tax=Sphaeramia orbicularis TaxID=375764 RepID=UPI001180D757|nr:C2 domain-containing protein 3 isoform X2 [Sphaeramia orbicularis]